MKPLAHTFRYLAPGPLQPGAEVALAPDDARHLMRVVRRGVGSEVELIDGAGGLWQATVTAADPAGVRVRVGAERSAPPPAPVRLCVGLLDSARLDLVVEKAAELGVGECVVLRTGRLRRAPDAEAWGRRQARLERVVAAATRQCGRARLMPVRGLVPFAAIVAETDAGTGFLIDPRGDIPLGDAVAAAVATAERPLTLAVGPEAGFAAEEVAAAREGGWQVCRMGHAVLRAETAAIAAATLACARLGDLGGRD